MKKNLVILIFYILFLSSYSKVMASEEIKYKLIKKNKIFEIRKYSDRLVVQTAKENSNKSFRKLFGYISGQNEINQKIEMTAPVTLIKEKNRTMMQFFLPSNFNENNVPNPTSSDLEILNIEGGFYAVIQYSGRSSDNNFKKYERILRDALSNEKILIIGSEIRATYNSPFVIPSLRRNEAMFKISWN